ncbi:hypothetical protein B0A52_06100 [Exophiala mesophila]|uniref:Uncharacterized protein n=1 Tax=Exophiala mesophila TaxID=212818 RepID=A0A438N5I9_EXOME|nr:hypothetical protein B0A52_06100 [Exophiala mesophila]
MGKRSKKADPSKPLKTPIAPWIYVFDATPGAPYLHTLQARLPSVVCFDLGGHSPGDSSLVPTARVVAQILLGKHDEQIVLVRGSEGTLKERIRTANALHTAAIKHDCNFASINISTADDETTKQGSQVEWGTNHLEIKVEDVEATTEKIFKWLFTAFTVHETIHLIDPEELKVTDPRSFPGSEYCPVAEHKLRPRDAKVHFVAIILSRPVLGADQRLTWTVADKSGVANFYFQYRGEHSKYTWDWVQSLKPGERTILPRAKSVEVKEAKSVQVAKAPFRGIGLAFTGVGLTVQAIGHGLGKVGHAFRMGHSRKWVSEGDLVDGKEVNWKRVFAEEEARLKNSITRVKPNTSYRPIKVFDEKGRKTWVEEDETASTQADSASVKWEKEFC